jgi:DNA transposition AAA+ family ATPase
MNESDKVTRLRYLAGEIRNYQLERDWSDSKLVREIAHLGSTKTFKRILNAEDDLAELNLDNQLNALENAAELIATRRAKDLPPEPEYDDFRNIISVRQAVAAAMQEESIARFICVEGQNGTGKDAAIHALAKIWPKPTAFVEAHDLWRDSLAIPLADIINCLSVRRQDQESGEPFRMPHLPAQRLEIVLEELGKRKVILLINEAHSMGPRGLNLVRTIISRTPCIPVLFCIPVLLSRLIKVGYEEAAQLFGNRLCRRVRLESPAVDEILLMMKRRHVTFADAHTAAMCAERVASEAPKYGNWRFVTKVTRRAFTTAAGKPVVLEKFTEAIMDVKSQSWSQQGGKA